MSGIKRRKFVWGVLLLIAIISVSVLSACDIGSRYGNWTTVDGVILASNKTHKKSLSSSCEWDGDKTNMQFTIPDEYDGFKVTDLGAKGNPGFSGKPSDFTVRLPSELDGLKSCAGYGFVPDEMNAGNTVVLNFTVNIGKLVKTIDRLTKYEIIGYGVYDDAYIAQLYYKVVINYVIDAENETFYSMGGDVYYKSNNKIYDYKGLHL